MYSYSLETILVGVSVETGKPSRILVDEGRTSFCAERTHLAIVCAEFQTCNAIFVEVSIYSSNRSFGWNMNLQKKQKQIINYTLKRHYWHGSCTRENNID